MSASQIVFVYGTLKRGQCREKCWPRAPLSVQPAFVRGRLLCLGPFPGLVEGEEWIRGEAWKIAHRDLAETIRVLDQIEGFQQPQGADQYQRIEIELFEHIGEPSVGRAITYRLADRHLQRCGRAVAVTPMTSGASYAEWFAADG